MRPKKVHCDDLFFRAVSMWLAKATMQRCSGQIGFKVISGDLIQRDYQATINVVFCPSQLKQLAPIVYCRESWLRDDIDWHSLSIQREGDVWNSYQQLCWIHPAEWMLAHNNRQKRLHTVVDEGATWLRNNLTKLLECHWAGHLLGIHKWRPEWGGWDHGHAGTKEFVSERKAHGLPNNWELTSNN